MSDTQLPEEAREPGVSAELDARIGTEPGADPARFAVAPPPEEALSTTASATEPEAAAGAVPPGLLPEDREEIEAILNALRQWLVESAALRSPAVAGTAGPSFLDPSLPEPEGGDLHALVRELAALRAEVHIEAKGARAAREKIDEATAAFERGIESTESLLEDMADSVETGVQRALDPLAAERDALREKVARLRGELDVARGDLERKDQEIRRAQEDAVRAKAEGQSESQEALMDGVEFLRRGRRATEDIRRRLGWRGRLLPAGLFGGLIEGYGMAARRLERTLEKLGIVEIRCDGAPFDARRMKVVETEVRPDLPVGHVVDVVRPGFVKGDQVVRFAEVRTAVSGPVK